jgi:hypothetical protein
MRRIIGGVIFVVVFAVAVLALRSDVAHVQPLHDHFKIYNVDPWILSTPIDVVLRDQFGEMQGTVEQIRMFSPPVEKMLLGGQISPIIHPENHLTWYDFIGPVNEPQRTLLVSNQFGADQEWVVRDPIYLLLPTWKFSVNGLATGHPPPTDLDHYLCYDVISGPPVGLDGVTLTDQFHQEYVTVGDPLCFCNPVDKIAPDDGLPIYDNENHLACYDISPHLPPPLLDVLAEDQFGLTVFTVLENEYLCVPSTKKIKPPPTCMAGTAEGVE